MRRHRQVHQLAAAMSSDQQDVERRERERLDHEQIGRPDRVGVGGQEGAPRLARQSLGAAPPGAADRAVADDDAQLQQLASDTFAALERVLGRHLGDQLLDLGTEPCSAHKGTRLPAPLEAPARAVPADHRRWLDDNQVLRPVTPE